MLTGQATYSSPTATAVVKVSNGAGTSANYTITVTPVNGYGAPVLPTSLSPSTAGQYSAYAANVTQTSGSPGTTYQITSGTLPAGLSMTTSTSGSVNGGVITGTPTVPGTYTFTVTATNLQGSTSQSYTLTVAAAPVVTSLSQNSFVTNSQTSISISATNSPTSYAISGITTSYIDSNYVSWGSPPANYGTSLPRGLTFNSSGTITGTVVSDPLNNGYSPAGTSTFSITATNAYGTSLPVTFTITWGDLPSFSQWGQYTDTANVGDALPDPTQNFNCNFICTGNTPNGITLGTNPGLNPFSVTAGQLPPGVAMNTSNGSFSGSPTTAGTYNWTLTVTNALGSANQAFSVTITNNPVLPHSIPGAIPGQSVHVDLNTLVTGGVHPYTFTYNENSFSSPDPGVTFDPTTGIFSGTATVAGNYTYEVRVTDATGATNYYWGISFLVGDPPSFAGQPLMLSDGDTASSYWDQAQVTTGAGNITYSLVGGSLPPGITTFGNGTQYFTGTPTTPGTYTFVIKATNSIGYDVHPYTIFVDGPPSQTATTLPGGAVGTAYSQNLVGWADGQSWSVTSGALPNGLSLSPSTGQITGTPTVGGSFTFTVAVAATAGNYLGQSASQTYTMTVGAPPSFSGVAAPPNAAAGSAYSFNHAATSGDPTITYSLTGAPSWLSISSAGVLTGTPTSAAVGSASFTVTATNNFGSASRAVTLAVQTPASLSQGAPPAAVVGVPYSFTPTVTGTGSFTWTITGTLPSGLSFNNSNGQISGVPTGAGSTGSFSISVTGAIGAASTLTTSITSTVVAPVATNATDTATWPNLNAAAATYSMAVNSGSSPVASWSMSSWTLAGSAISTPSWATLSSTGTLSGTPTTDGVYTVALNATNAGGTTTTVLTLTVTPLAPVLTTTTTIQASPGVASSTQIVATGGTPTSWSTGGTVPTGVVVSSSGVLTTTTATPAGTYTFTVTATNTGGSSTTAVTLNVQSVPVITSPVSLYWATGAASSYTIVPTAGATPFSYAIISSSVPSWLSVGASSGVLGGTTASTPTTYTATVQVSNTPGSANLTANITTLNAPVWSTVSLPTPVVGQPYSYTLPTPSGSGPFTYSASGLPAGLSVNATTGVISGTPTTGGATTVSFTAVNTAALTASLSGATLASALTATTTASTTATVVAPVYSVSTLSQYVQTSAAFSTTPVLSSGSPATSWSVTTGSLPSWLTLGAGGALTGTAPSTATTASFTVTGTNSAGTAAIAYTLTVQAPPTAPTLAPPAAVIGVPYSYTIPTPGGTGPFTYTLANGSTLPAGLALNSNGTITGTPTGTGSTGTFQVVINNGLTTQNGSGAVTTASASITSSVTVPVATHATDAASWPNLNAGAATYTMALNAGSTPVASWTATSWTLAGSAIAAPSWATFSNGVLSGTPTAAGVYTVNLNATNSAGTATTVLTLTVTGPPVVSPMTTSNFSYGVSNTYTLAATSSYPSVTGVTATATGGGALPSWITVSASGVITANPPVGTPSPYTFQATFSNGVGSPVTTTVTVPLVTAAPTIASTTNGGNVPPLSTSTYQVTQSGGTPASSYVLGTNSAGASNTAPSWVSINSTTGQVTFTNPPNSAVGQTFTFPVTLSNSGGSATTQLSITVADVPILPATLSYTIATGTAWTHDIASDVTSSNGPFTWALATGSTRPSWMNSTGVFAASTGVMSGTPTAAGSYSFVVNVTNAHGTSATTVTITTITLPTLAISSPLGTGTTGLSYSASAAGTGGSGSTFTYSATGLPAGLSINPNTGLITGTPTAPGTSSVVVTVASNTTPQVSASQTYSLVVTTVAPTVGSTLALTWYTTSLGSYTFASTAGSPVASWTLGTGAPAGVSLTGAVLSGTPTLAGTYTFNVTATNGGGSGVTAVTMTVISPPVIATISAQTASTAAAYSLTIPVTGGGGSYSYALATGSTLPTGLTLNSNGTITGTATGVTSATSVTVNVTNAAGTTPVTFSIGSATPVGIASTTTIAATVNQAVSTTLVPTGTGSFSYAVTSGSLPTGLSLNTSTGAITGTPTSATTSSFTITVTGALGTAATTVSYTATVAAPVLPATLALFATETQAFTTSYAPTGGSLPTSWTLVSGSAPTGFTLSNAGVHSGTPASGSAGSYSYHVSATNTGGTSNQTTVTLTVLTMPVLNSTTLNQASAGTSYSASAAASTGSGTLTYAVTAGSLPVGLSLNPTTGQITGTPTQTTSGTVSFTVTVTNQAGTQVSAVMTLPVAVPVVSSSSNSAGSSSAGATSTSSRSSSTSTGVTSSNATGASGTSSSTAATVLPSVSAVLGTTMTQVTVPGLSGTSTHFAVTAGTLPNGVTLNPSTGVLSGTPTGAVGGYSVTVTATGLNGQTATYVVNLQVSQTASTGTTTPIVSGHTALMWLAVALLALLLIGLFWFIIAKRRRRKEEERYA